MPGETWRADTGALKITYTILEVPSFKYSKGPQTPILIVEAPYIRVLGLGLRVWFAARL